MGLQDSYLSQSKYGYDTAVAVSQKALNSVIKNYFADVASSSEPFTEQTLYYVKNSTNGHPEVISLSDLLAQTNNVKTGSAANCTRMCRRN